MRYSVKTFKCMACKTPISAADKTLCEHCQPREGEIYRKHLGKVVWSDGGDPSMIPSMMIAVVMITTLMMIVVVL